MVLYTVIVCAVYWNVRENNPLLGPWISIGLRRREPSKWAFFPICVPERPCRFSKRQYALWCSASQKSLHLYVWIFVSVPIAAYTSSFRCHVSAIFTKTIEPANKFRSHCFSAAKLRDIMFDASNEQHNVHVHFIYVLHNSLCNITHKLCLVSSSNWYHSGIDVGMNNISITWASSIAILLIGNIWIVKWAQ